MVNKIAIKPSIKTQDKVLRRDSIKWRKRLWNRNEGEVLDWLLKTVNNKFLEDLPKELYTILTFTQDKIRITQASKIIGRTPNYFNRRVKWLKQYLYFLLLKSIYIYDINKTFKQIGYFKNGKEKKGFKIFKYLWEAPFYPSYVIAEKFGVKSNTIRKTKSIYLKKMKEIIPLMKDTSPMFLSVLLRRFDNCVFLFLSRNFKRQPIVKKNIQFTDSLKEEKDEKCSKFDSIAWDKKLKKLACKAASKWLLHIRDWQYFVVLTFEDSIHPEQAEKYYRRWIRKINEEVYGKRYRRHHKSITWVRGIDYQRRNVLHFNALFSGLPEDWGNFRAMYLWENMGDKCGFARILPFKKGACAYVASRSILKGEGLDIWIERKRKKDKYYFSQ
ncbi:hypothetical protein KAX08_01525 [candidate division WOR-3 bacterium]|nr:hypothetical protein [candidate division WOR-3 bacterium]